MASRRHLRNRIAAAAAGHAGADRTAAPGGDLRARQGVRPKRPLRSNGRCWKSSPSPCRSPRPPRRRNPTRQRRSPARKDARRCPGRWSRPSEGRGQARPARAEGQLDRNGRHLGREGQRARHRRGRRGSGTGSGNGGSGRAAGSPPNRCGSAGRSATRAIIRPPRVGARPARHRGDRQGHRRNRRPRFELQRLPAEPRSRGRRDHLPPGGRPVAFQAGDRSAGNPVAAPFYWRQRWFSLFAHAA